MGINNIEVMHDNGEPKPELERQLCPNIFKNHRPHQWGERGKIYWCNGTPEG